MQPEGAGPAPACGAPWDPPWLVLDACVLMSSIVRPLLLDLAREGWFRPLWSERIGAEWRRNAARIWGTPPAELERAWQAMQRAHPQADVGDAASYEVGLRYSDPKDHHVIAAGLAARARAQLQGRPTVRVLTWNLKDFNRAELKRQDMSAWDPDRQLAQWFELDPRRLAAALEQARRYALARGRDEPLADTLHRERLFRTQRLLAASNQRNS